MADRKESNFITSIAEKSSKKQKQRKRKQIWLSVSGVAAALFLAVVIWFGFFIAEGLPSLEELENPTPKLASKIYAADGQQLGQFYIENRIEADIENIPEHFIDALIATEDRKFFDHWGVDLDRLAKAIIKNIFMFRREGASTLTQQLAKNLYELKVQNETLPQTLVRKIREWITAIQIEKTYTKKEIVELYLNISYFGRSAHGIESAARIFFGKKASELNIPESAMLVALLKSSVGYDPIRRPNRALKRRNLVLYNLYDAGYITYEQYATYQQQPIQLADEEVLERKSVAPHFEEYIRQQMRDITNRLGYDLYRDGLNIYTTLDLTLQRCANEAVAEHLEEYQKLFNEKWNWNTSDNRATLQSMIDRAARNTDEYKNASSDDMRQEILAELKSDNEFIEQVKQAAQTLEAGFVVLDPHTGEIKAMVGGSNLEFGRGLNHATQIRRQPGSSFKPFTYITALENGLFPGYAILNEKFDYNGWSPDNSDDEYGGYVTLREGLRRSLNVVAGRLVIENYAPAGQIMQYARRMGVTSEMQAYPTIALGVFEVSPLEMASAYGTIANDGVHITPASILRIEDKNGVLIDQFKPVQREALSIQTTAIITDMLEDAVNYGTGARVRRDFKGPAAGKTGTTNDFSDAWFVGFTPHLTAATWVGFDDMRVKFTGWYGQGGRAALPIWSKFMKKAYEAIDYPNERFELPPGVVNIQISTESIERGETRVANEYCSESIPEIADLNNVPPECDESFGQEETPAEEQGTEW